MKKYLLLLSIGGLLIFLFGCSSAKNTINKQNEIENKYTIVKDSISSSQLNRLLDTSVKKVVVSTKDTIILVQKVCEVRDSSITILRRLDYELYNARFARWRENYILGKVTEADYPKPESSDTLIIPNNTIQSINYSIYMPSKNLYQKYSESDLKLIGYGLEFDYRKDEFTAGAFIQMQISFYRPIIELNTTFNTSKENVWVSTSALYSGAYYFFGGIIAFGLEGRAKTDLGYVLLIFSPLLLTNAEHHIFIIDPATSEGTNNFGLSVFAGFRTDIYDTEWIVYSPGVGVQISYSWDKKENISSNKSIDFQIGIEYPYEFRLENFEEPKITVGIKMGFQ